ncbi:1-acyl-sn-glycerol-3-phosphate acyltransferase, partial [Psychrosphaera sp. F3M07]|uniref:1-acyl-sn-glycerol-3-phosphate acyltransferase n=1 Tax=Psychrosphaera sp. F3M07 TaxID=2841560 RepID=UPI001C08EF3B
HISGRDSWQIKGEFPADKKCVICVAPHTSNWDFFIAIFAVLAMDIKLVWGAKHQIFIWPIKSLLGGLGGMPINRKQAGGVVGQIVNEFKQSESMVFALAPEGTRHHVPKWKNGFLRIAKEAQVPVYLVHLDYKKKEMGFGPSIVVDDLDASMEYVRNYYRAIPAKHPDKTS